MPASPELPAAASPLFEDGWYRHALRRPSPHCNPRPPGDTIDLVVLHSISLPAGRFGGNHVDDLFMGSLDCAADPSFADLAGLRVSAHFLIRRGGELLQYVSCEQRAWHAGVSSFRGRDGCNDFSIGIELEGCDQLDFEAAQYDSLAALLGALLEAYPRIAALAGHCDIAPGRKTDPGPRFDWLAVARASGLGSQGLPRSGA